MLFLSFDILTHGFHQGRTHGKRSVSGLPREFSDFGKPLPHPQVGGALEFLHQFGLRNPAIQLEQNMNMIGHSTHQHRRAVQSVGDAAKHGVGFATNVLFREKGKPVLGRKDDVQMDARQGLRHGVGTEPRWGSGIFWILPRVARSAQPWASGKLPRWGKLMAPPMSVLLAAARQSAKPPGPGFQPGTYWEAAFLRVMAPSMGRPNRSKFIESPTGMFLLDQGCAKRATLGTRPPQFPTPTGSRPAAATEPHWGSDFWRILPKVARFARPWAYGKLPLRGKVMASSMGRPNRRKFMESPTGMFPLAQGCAERATLGTHIPHNPTPKGLRPAPR